MCYFCGTAKTLLFSQGFESLAFLFGQFAPIETWPVHPYSFLPVGTYRLTANEAMAATKLPHLSPGFQHTPSILPQIRLS
jgi:hypothetical protein